MEAWEHIAPELPPGWSVVEDEGRHAVIAADGGLVERCIGTREMAADASWAMFGITRKRYAELIAVERVREVAAEKVAEGHNVEVHFCSLGRVIVDVVSPIDARHLFGHGQGPTLCDAAWACIQALGGGE